MALVVDAATFGVSAAFLLLMRVSFAKPAKQTFLTDLREGWSEFTRRTWVWVCVCHFALFQFAALAPFFVLGPLIAEEELGGASAYATISAFGGIGSVIGSVAAIRFRPDRQLVAAFLSLLIWTPVLLAYAVAAPVWAISALALVGAAGMNFAGTIWFTALQQHVPQHALSRVTRTTGQARSSSPRSDSSSSDRSQTSSAPLTCSTLRLSGRSSRASPFSQSQAFATCAAGTRNRRRPRSIP